MNSDIMIYKARQIVLDNLHNHQFGVSTLAKELGISRTELYRIIKLAEGKSVSQFIREIRLVKAAELLDSNSYSIAEVAYAVGFNSPTYFSTCFKEYFGYSPSQPNAIRIQPEKRKERRPRKPLTSLFIGIGVVGLFYFMLSLSTGENNEREKSLAVLKFDYIGVDTADFFLAHTVADEIIASLSGLGTLKVVSASSSFQIDKSASIGRIGRKLGINYIVDGVLIRDNNQLKATVKLIDTRTGYQLWSETYLEKFESFFEVQQKIAHEVAQKLNVTLAHYTKSNKGHKRTASYRAFELYVKATELGEERSGSAIDEAIKLLDTAVTLDPNFAEAYAELSFLYGQKHFYSTLGKEERNKMMHLNIQKAYAANPESPEVIFAIADYEYRTGGMTKDSSKIIADLRKALEIMPNNARFSYKLYLALKKIDQRDAAFKYLVNAVSLDPLNLFYKIVLAETYFWHREEQEIGLGIIEEILEDNPKYESAIFHKALMLADNPRGDLISSFKLIHNAHKEDRYEYGYLYWGSLIATDLALLPIAKKYIQLVQLRFPDNPIYTFEPTFNACIMQQDYDDALDLVKIWARDKNLNEDVVAARMARIYFLKQDFEKSRRILINQFPQLFDKLNKKQLNIAVLQPMEINPIRTYIEIMRMQDNEQEAVFFADLLCNYFRGQTYHRLPSINIRDRSFARMECFYLQNDLENFIRVVDESFFETRNRLALFTLLQNSTYLAFESEPEYQLLHNKIYEETKLMRSEVIDYLEEQGDWNTAWNKELQLNSELQLRNELEFRVQ